MIGLSLPYRWLLTAEGDLPSPSILLPQLWERGVRSIEIRMVPLCAPASDVLKIADLLWDYGFNVTVHSKSKTAENAVKEILSPLSLMLANMRQSELTVTVHPIVGSNVDMLNALSDYIIENGYPVKIALENERRLPDKTNGDGLALVLDAVSAVDRDNVGICFDMGHFAWYMDNFTDSPNELPPKDFLARVIHTHIHAYTESTTHFPLDEWRVPFSKYINALSHNYFGVYNIELSPQRFEHRMGAVDGYLKSVDTLKENFPFNAALYNDLRLNYDYRFHRAIEVFDKREGCHVSLINSSSYLFSTNGYRWAMDIAFRNIRYLSKIPAQISKYLDKLDLIVLTHAHADHMEESTIRALSKTEISGLIPNFLVDDMLKFGIRRDKLIVAKVGEALSVGPLTVRVLPGKHFRPDSGKGIAAVGYMITADNSPSLAFPGDIRDYSTEGIENLNADYCFSHVWLTDDALNPDKYIPKSKELAEFMLKMSEKTILLTHLYENARKESGMWQLKHARIACNAILEKSPQTRVVVPKIGEALHLY